MTTIQSGYINTAGTGNNFTPTGQPKQIAVDNPYVSKDEYVQTFEAAGLGITINSPQYQSGELDRVLLRASAMVNRFCRKYFDTQTIDETKTQFTVRPYNPQLVTVVLNNRPYSSINAVYIQVLQWFIQVLTSGPGSYLQSFPDYGYYKIVPLLSTAGTGVGSPIPAQILDHIPLGVLWTNYTFGYGTPLTSQTLTQVPGTKQYQAPLGNRLWAPSQVTTIYDSGTPVTTGFTIDYPNGMVTFTTHSVTGAITADFVTNESVPFDIKEAVILAASWLIAQARDNPLGANSYSIQTFSVSWGDNNATKKRFEELLEPYASHLPVFF